MPACGSCPACSQGVPVCIGGICVAPEEAVVHGSFLFAIFASGFNFFVAQRESVKKNISRNKRAVIFFIVPVFIAVMCVHMGVLEIPTLDAIKNSLFGTKSHQPSAADKIRAHLGGHGHSQGHAAYHEDAHGHGHIGHFHN